jgi:hypothetical protein
MTSSASVSATGVAAAAEVISSKAAAVAARRPILSRGDDLEEERPTLDSTLDFVLFMEHLLVSRTRLFFLHQTLSG